MTNSHTDHITLGRNVVLTYEVLNGIANRRAREQKRAKRWARIKSLWKKVDLTTVQNINATTHSNEINK